MVAKFPYLGLILGSSGKMDVHVDRQIAQASKAFGTLRKSVFLDKNLSLCKGVQCLRSVCVATWWRMLDPSLQA